ncbi:hypothetical protein DL93DRAFT_738118 [Clavulina sp. PMI_390]|nr:hypothetical protein DL93DRAFT_738118 [Clavulina sp. PMI_390]
MSVDPTILNQLLDAHKALAASMEELPALPHILSLHPAQRADFQNTVNQAHERLDALTDQLTSMRCQIDVILANEIRRSEAQLNSCTAPIGYIPAEVFRYIIRLNMESHQVTERSRVLRTFLAVSTTWRDLILSEAPLFTFIDWRRWNADLIALWRSRAKDQPISIQLDGRWPALIVEALYKRNGDRAQLNSIPSNKAASQEQAEGSFTVSRQRTRPKRDVGFALLDQLAAALSSNCHTLCLDWDSRLAFANFQSWLKLQNIKLHKVDMLKFQTPATMSFMLDEKRLPSLRRIESIFLLPLFPDAPPPRLRELSLVLHGGQWSDCAACLSQLQPLEFLSIGFDQWRCYVDQWPKIKLPHLKIFELCSCRENRFIRKVLPSFDAPNVRELVLDHTGYSNEACWRVWFETFPNVTRLVVLEDAGPHDHTPRSIQLLTSLQRLFQDLRPPSLTEIHVIAEFGFGALVAAMAILANSYPKIEGQRHHIRRLSLPCPSYSATIWFQETIEQLQSGVRVWDELCELQGWEQHDPSTFHVWMDVVLRREGYETLMVFNHFEATVYMRALESWLALSESVPDFQAMDSGMDLKTLRDTHFRQDGSSIPVAIAQSLVREARDTLQREIFDSGLWDRILAIRQLQPESTVDLDSDLDDIDGDPDID